MAVYAIGDIQGCYDPLRALLDALRFDPDADTLWLTGDLVNRGPKSLKTLRFVKSLGNSAITVLGNHDLHLLALSAGKLRYRNRFETLQRIFKASDCDDLVDWLRHRPLAHYDKSLKTLLVHAGTHPAWSAKKTIARAAEVEAALQSDKYKKVLGRMYGNSPVEWSPELAGPQRLRFIINCLTRMRMLTRKKHLSLSHSGSPFQARKNLIPWYAFEDPAWAGTRVVFGHWSALGLIVLPHLISLDTGCIWGRQLTAVRLDKRVPRIIQVKGQS
jgi:bis(5'-nucleosyl)-tetraphosphatase (symmetrical)